MQPLDQITTTSVGRWFGRYRPYLAVVAAVVLLAVFLPGDDEGGSAVSTGPDFAGQSGFGAASGAGEVDGGDTVGGDETATGPGGATTGPGPGGGGATGGGGESGVPGAPGGSLPVPEGVGAECDPATGRIKIPTIFAAPCAQFSGDNGGATYTGVTADEVTVVWYQQQTNPAVDAALTAAGANNTRPEQQATVTDWVDFFADHYETYGRKVDFKIVEGSGASDDDEVGKADAIKIATEIKPFVVFSTTTNNAFMDELWARKTVCVCSVSQPQEYYEQRAPYVGYTTLMSSTEGYMHRAEYIGKRLARRKAEFAGTSDGEPLNIHDRSFALLYFETADNAYRSGAEFFRRHLKEVYGVTLKDSIAFTGPPRLDETQQQARPFIARLKEKGVTSVVFAGDPISPAIFTQEATRQRYFPEWIITGSALTDTTIFARTYDQLQWDKAFGISFLVARLPREQANSWRLFLWHHGREPDANNQNGVLFANPFITFTGIHLAGPVLTPETFQRGLFNYPVTGQGMITEQTRSWGNHGLWPFVDYTQYDDVTEIWWDPDAVGEDEVGNEGKGMYRYVDGGRRYLPGQHPTSDVTAFDPAGTVTLYDRPPESDRAPEYQHQPHD